MRTGSPSTGDGRNIDLERGELGGEAAEQAVPERRGRAQGGPPESVWQERSGDSYKESYYDRPVIKEPVWIWAVPAYFYVGGAAGAAGVLGAVADAVDRERYEDLVGRCKIVALAGTAIGGGLLVYDLGRPGRFLNMLRVFRPTSAMSMGSWALAAAGASDAAALLFPRSRLLSAAAGLAALPETGYTAVLLSDTAVPIWQGTRKTLPLLFVASAASSAASLLELGRLDRSSRRAVSFFGIAARALEVAAARAVEKEAAEVERVARPLSTGAAGSLWKFAKAAAAGGLVLAAMPDRGRLKRTIAGALGMSGALALRFAIFHAGVSSARDPQATFEQQRAGEGGAAV